jgi:hypothetical protein
MDRDMEANGNKQEENVEAISKVKGGRKISSEIIAIDDDESDIDHLQV